MSEQDFITLGGVGISRCTLSVPHSGAWFADIWIPTDDDIESGATLKIGDTELIGTVSDSGKYGHRLRARYRAGGGGWSKSVPAQSYHNDGGVKAFSVARDVASAAGETLGDFDPPAERLGNDFVRVPGRASATLELVGGFWWVDYAGLTHCGTRSESTSDAERVVPLNYDPVSKKLALSILDLSDVAPGMTVDVDGQDVVIRSLEFQIDEKGIECEAWTGDAAGRDRMGDVLRAIAERATDRKLPYAYEYKVTSLAGTRLNLEPTETGLGLPKLSAVSSWASPGISAQIVNGSRVAVGFLNGNPAKPFAFAYEPPDGSTHNPDRLDLGGPGGVALARLGDPVSVLFPPSVPVSGTLSGAPFVGTMLLTTQATGIIQGASTKVFGQ